jgi:hypothetical protein
MTAARNLKIVVDDDGHPSTDALVRQSIQRRAILKRELAAEEARLAALRPALARQRGVAFIRIEALEREFLK